MTDSRADTLDLSLLHHSASDRAALEALEAQGPACPREKLSLSELRADPAPFMDGMAPIQANECCLVISQERVRPTFPSRLMRPQATSGMDHAGRKVLCDGHALHYCARCDLTEEKEWLMLGKACVVSKSSTGVAENRALIVPWCST